MTILIFLAKSRFLKSYSQPSFYFGCVNFQPLYNLIKCQIVVDYDMKKKANQKNKKIKHRKVTIDELALMIGKGFRGVDERFNKVDERFAQMDERFDRMDERMGRMEMKLDSLERRIFAIEDILTKHGRSIEEIKRDIKEIKEELKALKKTDNGNLDKIFALEQRIKVLEIKVA